MTHMIYTIGHGTHPVGDFIAILQAYGVETLVDVRRFSASRRNPQFNEDALDAALRQHNIGYAHLEGLGGRRKTSPASLNTAWKNLSFRGYADYMQTTEFGDNLAQLIKFATLQRTAIMCAEVVPWRCHRTLISDALLAQGFQVTDILSLTTSRLHHLTPWAKVNQGVVTYPKEGEFPQEADG